MNEPKDILTAINALLSRYPDVLKVSKQGPEGMEVIGTFPVQQGRQKVEGHYFASTLIKPKDVRLYFFPIYTHPEQFELSEDLQKCLKGKSCFHIKRLNTALSTEIKQMIARGVTIYQKAGII
jgi:hypothetical protein